MIYKYEDLVVVPKSELFRFQPPMSGEVKHLQLLAKPLLLIVEDAFNNGNVGAITQQEIRLAKEEFIKKGFEV